MGRQRSSEPVKDTPAHRRGHVQTHAVFARDLLIALALNDLQLEQARSQSAEHNAPRTARHERASVDQLVDVAGLFHAVLAENSLFCRPSRKTGAIKT